MFNDLYIGIMSAISAAPVNDVNGAVIKAEPGVTAIANNSLSMFEIFLHADTVVKFIILLLLFASIWSWAIIFEKIIALKVIRKKMHKFEQEFWSGVPFDRILKQIKGNADHPLALIFVAAMDELQELNVDNPNKLASQNNIECIEQAMQVVGVRAIESLESNVGFLATVASSAPFVGLFGTVWGIMVSMKAIAVSKSVTLATVAPGIAEALFATAVGLAAAIPAMIFYNRFAAEFNKIELRIQNFSLELRSMIVKLFNT